MNQSSSRCKEEEDKDQQGRRREHDAGVRGLARRILIHQRDRRQHDKDADEHRLERRWRHPLEGQKAKYQAQNDDVNNSPEHGDEHACEGAGHGRDCYEGHHDDYSQQKEILQQRRKSCGGIQAGMLEQPRLHEQERQVEEDAEIKQLCSQERGPVVRARGPELSVADQWFVMNET